MNSGARLIAGRTFRWLVTASVLAFTVASARPAMAQLTVGSAVNTGFIGRGVDSSYDPVKNAYLVVHSTFTVVKGICVNPDGSAAGSAFDISSAGRYSNFSRARYSPDVNGGAGGFMVTWSSEDSAGVVNVRTRVVSCAGVVGSENVIGASAWLESAPAIGYSATSKKFFVAWGGIPNIRGTLVSLTGAASGSVVSLSTTYGRDPGVAWNPARDEFGVSFNGETNTGVYSALAIVPAADPTKFTRTTFNSITGGKSFITDLDFSPDSTHWVMVWCDGLNTMGAEFDEVGTFLSAGVVSFNACTADSLGLSFSPVTKTFLTVGILPSTDELKMSEMSGRSRSGDEKLGGTRGLYPRAAASTKTGSWLVEMTTPPDRVPAWASKTASVQSATQPKVTPPAAAVQSTPEGAIATPRPVYKWNATTGSTFYLLWVNDSTGTKIQTWYTAEAAGCGAGAGTCSVTPAVTLANGDGKWWVQTWNSAGFGPWSSGKSFTLRTPPGTATLVSPIGTIYYSTPDFRWNAVSDATWYHLWVNDASGKRIDQWFTAEQARCPSGTSQCAVWPELGMASGVGNWWIQTWSAAGGYGDWSATGVFTLKGATLTGATVTSNAVQYRFERAPGATHYLLWVDNAGGVVQQWYNAADICTATACTISNSATLASGRRTWWILTWGSTWPSGGYGTWSASSWFDK